LVVIKCLSTVQCPFIVDEWISLISFGYTEVDFVVGGWISLLGRPFSWYGLLMVGGVCGDFSQTQNTAILSV